MSPETSVNNTDGLGWHVIAGDHLLEVLRRVGRGENPDLVYAELWANAKHWQDEDD